MKKKIHLFTAIRLVLLQVLLTLATMSNAAIEPEIKDYADCDTMDVDSSVVTFDNQSYSEDGTWEGSSYTNLGYVHYSIKNTAYIEINEYLDSCFLDTFSFWADIEVIYKDDDQFTYTDTVRLHVKYDSSLSQYNATKASYTFEEGLWSKAKLIGFSDSTLKKYIRMGQTLNIERYRSLDLVTGIAFSSTSKITATEEIKFSWNAITGAEAYELEWTWVDAYDNSGTGTLLNASEVAVNFRFNASAVVIDSLHYAISPAYESGFVVARVRPVGVNKYKKEQWVYGNWSNHSFGTDLSNYTENEDYVELASGNTHIPLDEDMNWQYAATFAELGKRKEVISYYDGSLRTRQSVTRISSNMQAIVGETKYDYEGRPAVNILPVPAFDQTLRFHPAFNLSEATGVTYNKNDFDSIPGTVCTASVAALKNTVGASNYYSPENDSADSRHFGFIPDAHGYPMTVTEYEPDGTGRIKRQGGVGNDHQLGSGHETKYYYATPGEDELDRLFGNAVGSEEHYQKEMVIDPNGQVSVSYKDLSGKVIATALAGDSPDSLTSLASESNALTTLGHQFKSTYLSDLGEIRLDNVIVVSSDNSLHEFTYDIDVPRLTLGALPNMCFDCVYDLEIKLTDECGNEVFDGDPGTTGNQSIVRTVGIAGSDFDVSCDTAGVINYNFGRDTDITGSKISVYLNTGTYTLTKILKISDNAIKYYEDKIDNDTNLKSLADFEAEAIAEQDTAFCRYTCDECLDSLGTYNDYYSDRSAVLIELQYAQAEIDRLIPVEWDAKLAQCSTLCVEPMSACHTIYNTLLIDVMPGGQYFPIPDSVTGILPITGILDTTTTGIGFNYQEFDSGGTDYDMVYLDLNGDTIKVDVGLDSLKPNELTRDQFYNLFQREWAHSLVKHHPEYCLYTFCADNQDSYDYNDSMYSVSTFKEAYEKGYMYPLTTGANLDPFFSDPSNSTHKTNFIAATDSFGKYGIGTTECRHYSILELSLLVHYLDGQVSSCASANSWLTTMLPLDTNVIVCDERADAVWRMFRSMYISQKNDFLDDVRCTPTIPTGYSRRFEKQSDWEEEVEFDNDDTKDSAYDKGEAAVLAACDTLCMNQAEYWLTKLGGCNFPEVIQDSLMDAFVAICRNGCDAQRPMGARNYPSSITERVTVPVSGGAYSFEEAFDKIVPDSLKGLEACDPWLISSPPGYNHDIYKLAGVDSACIKDQLDGDSCYDNLSDEMKTYNRMLALAEDENSCEDCIECEDLLAAWDSLSADYGGLFIDSTWDQKEILTNYFNAYFGFNLNYWDYKDFADECYEFGDKVNTVEEGYAVADDAWQSWTPVLTPEQKNNPFRSTQNYQYASLGGDDFFPIIQSMQQTQTGDIYVDTCVCNKLVYYLEQFGQTDSLEMDSILNGTATEHSLSKFDTYFNTTEGCGEPSSQEGRNALLACLNVYKTNTGTNLTSAGDWPVNATEALTNYVAYEDLKINNDNNCFSCAGQTPSQRNSFYSGTYSGSEKKFSWPGYTAPSLECDSFEKTIMEELVDHFGDTTQDGWDNFQECFWNSICEVMNSNSQWLCANCQPDDTLVTGDTIKSIYDSIWTSFNTKYQTIWDVTAMASGMGIIQGDSIVPSEDTLSPSERMELMMTMYGKCIVLPCNFCYPEGDTAIVVDTSSNCCKDTTLYYHKMLAFMDDFTDSIGFLGNYLTQSNFNAYPNNQSYYGSALYKGSCHQDITYRLISNRMPTLNFVMEDGCGDEFYVNLGYLQNHSNQANYGRIVDFKYIQIVPEPVTNSCLGTSRFILLADQVKSNGDTIEVEIMGVISKYELYSARLDSTGCDGPKLCNRAFGTIKRDILDPCVAEKLIRARSIAHTRYIDYKDSLLLDFKKKYLAKCMGAKDTLDMDYQLKEYHYTLYYYDQAGNLIQTVPPVGVNFITSQTDLDQIDTFRASGNGSPVYASHDLETRYKYNTLNEVRWQNTPDGGTSQFWYDRLGRMAVSQNAEQADGSNNNYSYTEYDSLGRISQVGQINNATAMTVATAFSESQLTTWIGNGTKTEITKTWYDQSPVDLSSEGFEHNNLRSRVAAIAYFETDDTTHEHAIFYDYDIHGNVQNLMREIAELHFIEQGYKKVSYDYDLVSGNVNNVYYQSGAFDQFTHNYLYDADNRLDDVNTSVDGVHWDRDAHYSYMWHGPLQRMLLGDLNVQGIDYAYTIHGWLKGVNSNSLYESRDIGHDGYYYWDSTQGPEPELVYSSNGMVARDVFGFSLHYYNQDYDPINEDDVNASSDYFLMSEGGSGYLSSVRSLYNGNISRMVTALGKITNPVIGKAYEYDQLNRISKGLTYTNYSLSTNSWNSGSGTSAHETEYTYDANGNILTLKRKDDIGWNIDDLTYHYITGTNQLDHVDDDITADAVHYDIDDQDAGNYTYDKIGNLISDAGEEIATIEWTVYGKIKSITRTSGSEKPDLSFEYSPDGHRVAKHVTDKFGNTTSTWYVRDASGNIMATYKRDWDVLLDTSGLNEDSIYVHLKEDKTFNSLLTFFDQSFSWHSYTDTNTTNGLESSLNVSTSLQEAFLDNFDATDYVSGDVYDSLLANTSDSIFLLIVGQGNEDSELFDHFCDDCAQALLEAMLEDDYEQFLRDLDVVDHDLFIELVFSLGLDTAADFEDQISDIQAVSSISNTADSLQVLNSYSCTVMSQVYDELFSFGTSKAREVYAQIDNMKSCLTTALGSSVITDFYKDYYGNSWLWDQILTYEAGSHASKIATIKTNKKREFIYYAVKELGQSDMDGVVENMSSNTLSYWFDKIKSHYGTDYYNELVQSLMANHNEGYWQYALEEHHIYGSSRLGIKKRDLVLYKEIRTGETHNYISTEGDSLIQTDFTDSIKYQLRGATYYELSNHLGNVLATITDRRIQSCGAGEVLYYEAQITSISDYYPFGMKIESRSWSPEDTTIVYEKSENVLDLENVGTGMDLPVTTDVGKELSVEVWFKSKPTSNYREMIYDNFHGGPNGPRGVTIQLVLGKLYFGCHNNSSPSLNVDYTYSGNVCDTQWHHAAMTIDSNDLFRFYLDGVEIHNKYGAGDTDSFNRTNVGRLGARGGTAGPHGSVLYAFNGQLKHLAAWRVIRSAQDILASYKGHGVAPGDGMIYHFPCDEGSGNVIYNKLTGIAAIRTVPTIDLKWTKNSYKDTVKSYKGYRFAFNGMERAEIPGGYTSFYRHLDSRIGRWFSLDPKQRNWESPYCLSGNNPIIFIDPDGDYFEFHQNASLTFKAKVVTYSSILRIFSKRYRELYREAKESPHRNLIVQAKTSEEAVFNFGGRTTAVVQSRHQEEINRVDKLIVELKADQTMDALFPGMGMFTAEDAKKLEEYENQKKELQAEYDRYPHEDGTGDGSVVELNFGYAKKRAMDKGTNSGYGSGLKLVAHELSHVGRINNGTAITYDENGERLEEFDHYDVLLITDPSGNRLEFIPSFVRIEERKAHNEENLIISELNKYLDTDMKIPVSEHYNPILYETIDYTEYESEDYPRHDDNPNN
jgi:RHS repeat-associated protein